MNKENDTARKLSFLNANFSFERLETIEECTSYTSYIARYDKDAPKYKTLYIQYWRNFVILFEEGLSSEDEFVIIDRSYFNTTKAHSLKEHCYRFLAQLREDNSSRLEDGDLLIEKNKWCFLSKEFIQEIKYYYKAIINSQDEEQTRFNLVNNGVKFRRITSNLFALLSALDSLWESFNAINIVKRTKFLLPEYLKDTPNKFSTLGLNNFFEICSEKYLEDIKSEKLPELKQEVLPSYNDENSYRHFYPEDVPAEKKRRQKETEERKKLEKEMLEAEAKEFGNFGIYAAMVAEGELHPDDPRYPF